MDEVLRSDSRLGTCVAIVQCAVSVEASSSTGPSLGAPVAVVVASSHSNGSGLRVIAPVGRNGVEELLDVVADPSDKRVPEIARACLLALGAQLRKLKEQILEFDRMIRAWHRSSEMSMRLDEAPGIGPVLATALVATVTDPKAFRSGRNFSAWIGLVVPAQKPIRSGNRFGDRD